jgi:nucleoid DNA-binding protein
MKKADIISRMAEGAGITKAQAEKTLDGLLNATTLRVKFKTNVITETYIF